MKRVHTVSDDTLIEKMVIIANEYGRTKDTKELSKELGLKVATIQQYAGGLRSIGVDVAKMKRSGIYLRALAVLKKDYPKLCKNVKV